MNTTRTHPTPGDDLDWVAETHPRRAAPAHLTWWGVSRRAATTIILVVAALGIAGVGVWRMLPPPTAVSVPEGLLHAPDATPPPGPDPAAEPAGGAAAEPGGTAFVHVAGAVARPGLIELPEGARVADALDHAGGPAPQADLGAINLAARIADGEQIYVPAQGEDPPPPPAGGAAGGGKVNINTATDTELQQLSGIGPVMAERIITYRRDHGPFTTVEELQSVPGIGPALMARLREAITV